VKASITSRLLLTSNILVDHFF